MDFEQTLMLGHNLLVCIEPLKFFWTVRYDLTVYQNLILRHNQIVIPALMWRHFSGH